jgi:hypothetical protein
MDLDQPLTLTMTRGDFLTVATAMAIFRKNGYARQHHGATLFDRGVGQQQYEDADRVLTKLSLQELQQAPATCGARHDGSPADYR